MSQFNKYTAVDHYRYSVYYMLNENEINTDTFRQSMHQCLSVELKGIFKCSFLPYFIFGGNQALLVIEKYAIAKIPSGQECLWFSIRSKKKKIQITKNFCFAHKLTIMTTQVNTLILHCIFRVIQVGQLHSINDNPQHSMVKEIQNLHIQPSLDLKNRNTNCSCWSFGVPTVCHECQQCNVFCMRYRLRCYVLLFQLTCSPCTLPSGLVSTLITPPKMTFHCKL